MGRLDEGKFSHFTFKKSHQQHYKQFSLRYAVCGSTFEINEHCVCNSNWQDAKGGLVQYFRKTNFKSKSIIGENREKARTIE